MDLPVIKWPWFLVMVLAGWIGLGSTAKADNPFLRDAIIAYENFEYDKALRLLEFARRHGGSTEKEKTNVYLFLGLVRFTLGDKNLAGESFRQALTLDPSLQLPTDTSPKIVDLFEEIKASQSLAKDQDTPKRPLQPDIVAQTDPLPPLSTEPKSRIWTWVCGGTGLAALGSGIVFGVLAKQAKNDFESEHWADVAWELKQTAENRSIAANVLFAVGGAALVASIILFFKETSTPSGPPDQQPKTLEFSAGFSPWGINATIGFW